MSSLAVALAPSTLFWVIVFLVISPGMMFVLAYTAEDRTPCYSMSPFKQYTAFWPGDIFMSIGVALLVSNAYRILGEVNIPWYAIVVAVAVCAVIAAKICVKFHQSEVDASAEDAIGSYSKEAMKSPTKQWHNFVVMPVCVFFVLGALLITLGLGIIGPVEAGTKFWLGLAFLAVWAFFMIVVDNIPKWTIKDEAELAEVLNARAYNSHSGVSASIQTT